MRVGPVAKLRVRATSNARLELRSRAAGGVNAAGAVRGFGSFNDSLAGRHTRARPKVLD